MKNEKQRLTRFAIVNNMNCISRRLLCAQQLCIKINPFRGNITTVCEQSTDWLSIKIVPRENPKQD